MLASSLTQASETVTYTYDSQGRLVESTSAGTVNDGVTVETSFDALGNRTNHTVTGAGAVISIGNASVTEGGQLSFTVTRSGITTTAVSASFASAGGTATSGSDFTATSGTVNFIANDTSETITVDTTDDSTAESAETMTVTLSSPSGGAELGTAVGTGTINDNDTAYLAIGNASVTEGGQLSFTVTRSGNTASSVSASYASANGTASSSSDYTAASGTVSFVASDTSETITVNTTNDSNIESNETLTVILSSPSSGAVITTAVGTGTINDNDMPTVTVSDASGTEGNGPSAKLDFTITMSPALGSGKQATVLYATANGTATAGSDYTSASNDVTFSSGQTTKTVSISLINNGTAESTETMYLNIELDEDDLTDAVVTDSQGVGTIYDND